MITLFIEIDTFATLGNTDFKSEGSAFDSFRVELMNIAPFSVAVDYNDDNSIDAKVLLRDEMMTDSVTLLEGTYQNNKWNYEGDEEALKTAKTALKVTDAMRYYFIKHELEEKYSNLEDNAGLYVYIDEERNLKTKLVTGTERPNLLCNTLFGGLQMVRPYADEIVDHWSMEVQSIEELEELADDGDDKAMEELAMRYLNGSDEVEPDAQKSYEWFEKAAEEGNILAQFNLGLFNAKGFGVERDFSKAADLMHEIADEDEDAEKCEKDFRKLAECLAKAKQGDASAQAELAGGFQTLAGSLEQAGSENDYAEAFYWAQESAKQGNSVGMWNLALCYHHGRGVESNMDKAIEWYQKGADLNNSDCIHNLGCEYLSGENIKKDAKKGFELIKKAAELGNGLAMRNLGKCYQFAMGTDGNMQTAIEWYEKALEIIDDPELERKVDFFKAIGEDDEDFAQDYPEDDSDDFEVDKYMTGIAPDAVSNSWKYEDELDEQGYMPEAPHGDDAWGDIPRVHAKAAEGDSKAISILKALDELDDLE